MRITSALLVLLVPVTGCGGDGPGEVLDGDVTGQYAGGSFEPAYAVAFTRDDGMFEIQFGDAAINCDHHLQNGPGNPLGLFARVMLDASEAAVGAYTGVFIEYDSLTSNGTHQSFSTDAAVTITAIDATTVAGSVTHSRTDTELQTLALGGSFTVVRCR